MQLQVVVHGGLPPIMSMATSGDSDDHRHAAMALGNIAANEGNHPQLVAKGAIQALVALSSSPELDVREYAGFALANLASNADYLDAIGAKGGIDPLVKLAGSANVHTQVGFCCFDPKAWAVFVVEREREAECRKHLDTNPDVWL